METKFKVGDLVRSKRTGQVTKVVQTEWGVAGPIYQCRSVMGPPLSSFFRESELEAYNPNEVAEQRLADIASRANEAEAINRRKWAVEQACKAVAFAKNTDISWPYLEDLANKIEKHVWGEG